MDSKPNKTAVDESELESDLAIDDETASLASRSRRRSDRRGAILFHQGDAAGEVFILRAGRVKVCARRGSREAILAVFDAGPRQL